MSGIQCRKKISQLSLHHLPSIICFLNSTPSLRSLKPNCIKETTIQISLQSTNFITNRWEIEVYGRKYFTDVTWRSVASGIPDLSSLMFFKNKLQNLWQFHIIFLKFKNSVKEKKIPCSNFAMQSILISSMLFCFSLQHFTSFSLIRCYSIVLYWKKIFPSFPAGSSF